MSKSHKEIHKKNPLARNWQRLLDIRHFLRNKFPFLDFSSRQSPHKDAGNGLRCIFHIIKSLQTSWTGRISHTHKHKIKQHHERNQMFWVLQAIWNLTKKSSRDWCDHEISLLFFFSPSLSLLPHLLLQLSLLFISCLCGGTRACTWFMLMSAVNASAARRFIFNSSFILLNFILLDSFDRVLWG